MNMRIVAPGIAFALLAFGASAATVEKAVVRQLWPWQDAILVEFRLSGVTGPTDVNITLSENGEPINLPASALGGELFALERDGLYQAKVTPPTGLIGHEVENLGVSVVPVAPQTSTNILYRIYDLDTGACEEVTAGSIVSFPTEFYSSTGLVRSAADNTKIEVNFISLHFSTVKNINKMVVRGTVV